MPSVPSAATSRLPGCRSTWNRPCTSTWSSIVSSSPVASASRRRGPRSSSTGPAAPSGVPARRPITSTRSELRSGYGTGTRTPRSGEAASAAAIAWRLSRSTVKSSSSRSASAKPAASARSPSERPQAVRSSSVAASRSRMSRSRSTTAATPGRRTLTTTSSPSGSRAACTCATDAAASGSRSTTVKASSTGRPRSAASEAATVSHGTGAARSCSAVSSSTNSAGSRSRRVDSCWPSLTNVTPPSSSAARSERASCRRAAADEGPGCGRPRRNRPRPCRSAMRTICA